MNTIPDFLNSRKTFLPFLLFFLLTSAFAWGQVDLEITQVTPRHNGNSNNRTHFIVVVKNLSSNTATNVEVTDDFPGRTFNGTDYKVSHGIVQYTSGTTLTWQIPYVPGGGMAVLMFSTTGGTGTNTATLTSLDQTDTNSGNNTSAVSSTVVWNPTNYKLTKTVDNPTPFPGQNVTFTIQVQHIANNNDSRVVTDLLPPGYDYVSHTASNGDGNYIPSTGAWTVDPGWMGTQTLTITAEVLENPDNIPASYFYNNFAYVGGSSQAVDSDISDNLVIAEVNPNTTPPAGEADLAITKTGARQTYGSNDATFTIAVTNNGPDDAADVIVTDELNASWDFPSPYTNYMVTDGAVTYTPASKKFEWEIDMLPVGQTAYLTFTVTNLGAAGSFSNTATAVATEYYDANMSNNTATVIATQANKWTDMEVTKSVSPAQPIVGQNVEFTITATRIATGADWMPADNVQVLDLLPSGYAYVSHTASDGTYNATTGIWTIGNINNATPRTLQITATPLSSGNYVNTAYLLHNSPDPDVTNQKATVSVIPTAVAEVDLSVTKIVDNNEPEVDEDIEFTITVTNNGPDDATGVVVTDVLPTGYDFVSSTQGTYNAGTRTITWNIGNLAASANTSFDVVATVLSSGTHNNTASVTGNEDDPDTNNNSDTVTVTPNIPTANLAITKTVDDNTPTVSQNVTFTLTATNNGPDDATGVVVTDQLPNGYTYVSHNTATGTYNQGTGEWAVGNLTNGNSAILTITATVLASGSYTNTASVTANENDPVPGNNTDSETPTVGYGTTDLEIQKIASHFGNDNNRYSFFGISVRNNGPDAATNIEVEDILNSVWNFSAQVYEVSHGTVTATGTQNSNIVWEIPYLPSGGVAVLLFRTGQNANFTDPWVGGRNNTATIEAMQQTDSNPTNNSVTTMSVPYWSNHLYELGISKSVNPANPYIGDEVEFTIVVEKSVNPAGGPDNLQILDKLPPGYTYVSSVATRGTYDSSSGIWSIGSAWEWTGTETLTITALVNPPTGAPDEYKNVAAIFSAGQFSDTEISNNMDSVTIPTPIMDPDATDLSISLSVDNETPEACVDDVIFTLTASNLGDNPATGVKVTDLLPDGYVYVGSSVTQGTYIPATGIWTVGNLAINADATLTITAEVLASGNYTNTAVISGNETDPVAANNTADTSVIPDLSNTIDLTITKIVDEDEPEIGTNVEFTIEIENNGSNAATGVVVTDVIPSGYEFVEATQGTYTSANRTVTWNVGDLAASATTSFIITAKVKAGGNHNNTASVSSNECDTNLTNNSASISVTPDLSDAVDLKIQQTVNDETPGIGDTVTFTVTATNEGPMDATGVSAWVLLANGFTITGVTPSSGTSYIPPVMSGGRGTWTIGDMAADATATLTVQATVLGDVGAAYVSIAEITSNEADFDNIITNNRGYAILSPVNQQFHPCDVNAEEPAFFDDFGSGASPYAPELEQGRTNMMYMSGVNLNDGQYTVAKNAQYGYDNWQDISDPSGDPDGYFMIVNADIDPYEFFRTRITLSEEFCTNTRYNINLKVINVNSQTNHDYCSGPPEEYPDGYIEPEIGYFVVNDKGEVLGAGTSGTIPYNEVAEWLDKQFVFVSGQDDEWIELVLFNKAPGGCGNDLAIDDITVYACMTPPIRLNMEINTTEEEVCGGETVTLEVDYTPDPEEDYVWPPIAWGGEESDVEYQWQRSDDGINFTDIPGETTDTYIIENFQEEDQAYYRLMYAQGGNIEKVFCRFPSAQFYPVFNATPIIPPIKIENDGPPYICGGAVPDGTLQLYTDYDTSAYVDEEGDSTWGPEFYHWDSSNEAVATIDEETGLITAVSVGTTTITYTVRSPKGACEEFVTKDISVMAICPSCVEDPVDTVTDGVPSVVGISTLTHQRDGWPENVFNGFIVLESKDKGFVITRVANTNPATIPNPVEGMLVYSIADKCIKLYNGLVWKCIERDCD